MCTDCFATCVLSKCVLWYTAICNTLQHTATVCCSVFQCVLMCSLFKHTYVSHPSNLSIWPYLFSYMHKSQNVLVYWCLFWCEHGVSFDIHMVSLLTYVAYLTTQRRATGIFYMSLFMQCVAVCCSVSQCVAVLQRQVSFTCLFSYT